MNILVQYFFRVILFLIGWNPVSNIIDTNRNYRVIFVFSHSTYFDVVFFLLYYLAYPDIFGHTHILINQRAYDKYLVLKYFKCLVPVPQLETTGNGTINALRDKFKNNTKFGIALSPKGTVLKREWKKGYYHLAKGLNCKLVCGGVDYRDHTIKMTPEPFDLRETEEETQKEILLLMSNVGPLYPEGELYTYQNSSNKAGFAVSLIPTNAKIMYYILALSPIIYSILSH